MGCVFHVNAEPEDIWVSVGEGQNQFIVSPDLCPLDRLEEFNSYGRLNEVLVIVHPSEQRLIIRPSDDDACE